MEPSTDAVLAEFIAAGLRYTDKNFLLAHANITVATLRTLHAIGIRNGQEVRDALNGYHAPGSLAGLATGQTAALRSWVVELETQFTREFATVHDREKARASVLGSVAGGAYRRAVEVLLPSLNDAKVCDIALIRLRLYAQGEARFGSGEKFTGLFLRLCEEAEARRPGLFGPAPARGDIAALALPRIGKRNRGAVARAEAGGATPEVFGALHYVRDRAAVYEPGAWRGPPLPLLALAARVLLSSWEVGLPDECQRAWAALLNDFGIHAG